MKQSYNLVWNHWVKTQLFEASLMVTFSKTEKNFENSNETWPPSWCVGIRSNGLGVVDGIAGPVHWCAVRQVASKNSSPPGSLRRNLQLRMLKTPMGTQSPSLKLPGVYLDLPSRKCWKSSSVFQVLLLPFASRLLGTGNPTSSLDRSRGWKMFQICQHLPTNTSQTSYEIFKKVYHGNQPKSTFFQQGN